MSFRESTIMVLAVLFPAIASAPSESAYGQGDPSAACCLDGLGVGSDCAVMAVADCLAVRGVPGPPDSVCQSAQDPDGFDCGCSTLEECPGAPPDPICSRYTACEDRLCLVAPRDFGDVNGSGAVNVLDVFCQLDLITTGGTSELPGCILASADICPCDGNGFVQIFGIFRVLDAIGRGVDPCCTPGACCLPDDSCVDVARGEDCGWYGLDGDFAQGETCATITCPLPP